MKTAYGSLNIHASLLPKYRGASPIQSVILEGEAETGITIMQMDAGIDTGDMLYTLSIGIEPKDTFETLHDKLMLLGGEAIVEALELLEEGALVPQKQDESQSTHVKMISKEMGNIDFKKSAAEIDRLVRGLNPWPSAFTFYKGKQMKIWDVDVLTEEANALPGMVTEVTKNEIKVACGQGTVAIKELQLEGKKRMSAHDFLLGVKVVPGDAFCATR